MPGPLNILRVPGLAVRFRLGRGWADMGGFGGAEANCGGTKQNSRGIEQNWVELRGLSQSHVLKTAKSHYETCLTSAEDSDKKLDKKLANFWSFFGQKHVPLKTCC